MTRTSINPGRVEWCGHSALACLGDTEDGRCSTLVRTVEVVLSPHGSGSVCLLLCRPDEAQGTEREPNLLISNNAPLAHWLLEGWLRKFPEIRDLPSMESIVHAELVSSTSGWTLPGAAGAFCFDSGTCELELQLSGLGEPIPVELRAEVGPTGLHEMYGVVVEANAARISVNGRQRRGRILYQGSEEERIGLAMMVLSQTWVATSANGGRADAA